MENQEKVTLELTNSEALVLFEWISRFNKGEKMKDTLEDQAEKRVLWDIECMLEEVLAEPFAKNYDVLLEKARSEVREKYTPES